MFTGALRASWTSSKVTSKKNYKKNFKKRSGHLCVVEDSVTQEEGRIPSPGEMGGRSHGVVHGGHVDTRGFVARTTQPCSRKYEGINRLVAHEKLNFTAFLTSTNRLCIVKTRCHVLLSWAGITISQVAVLGWYHCKSSCLDLLYGGSKTHVHSSQKQAWNGSIEVTHFDLLLRSSSSMTRSYPQKSSAPSDEKLNPDQGQSKRGLTR